MVQGTGSDVGKSLIVTGLARAFTRRGLKILPFKPQNMSNNAGVAADGGEIGRAQMLQARACGLPASVHMNPVLLKPQSDRTSQIIVQGRVLGSSSARDYRRLAGTLMASVMKSFRHLEATADLVLVEGAGSPAEINLRDGDIANMGFAVEAEVPVVLVGDIDRGGVIASIVGTMALLDDDERRLVRACCINRFRGDVSLFDPAIDIIRRHAGIDCLGVIPHLAAARRLPAEDAVALNHRRPRNDRSAAAIHVACLRFDRIANFDDLDPLMSEPDVDVRMIEPGEPLPGNCDLVVLPGSKSTLADLVSLRANGWDIDLAAHVRRNGWIIGLCGGYQMLGREVADPSGIEGRQGSEPGLGLLDITTTLAGTKQLAEVRGRDIMTGERIAGYEMHMGVTTGPDLERPMVELETGPDGAVSSSGRIMGCYMHGLFRSDDFRRSFLERLGSRPANGIAFEDEVDQAIDAVADAIESSTDIDRWLAIARTRTGNP
ncbi:MAG: cobyric acid synthase [Alphaproteobacteria bacterium]|nr:cobyric acid synthase [Alphaproteobacteria bacterium]